MRYPQQEGDLRPPADTDPLLQDRELEPPPEDATMMRVVEVRGERELLRRAVAPYRYSARRDGRLRHFGCASALRPVLGVRSAVRTVPRVLFSNRLSVLL